MTNPGKLTIDDLLAPAITTDEVNRVGPQLGNAEQRLLAVIGECVANNDEANLSAIRDGDRAVHKILAITPKSAAFTGPAAKPFQPYESCAINAARALAALGLALVTRLDRAAEQLTVFRRWIDHSGLAIPSEPVHEVPADVKTDHRGRIRGLAAEGELDLLSLIWLAKLDGWPAADSAAVKPGPSTSVLLDLGQQGQRAELRLSRMPDLPSGLVPDPATMTLSSADEAFRASLSTAWKGSGGSKHGAILWSLTDQAGPITRVTNESLSLAFTVLFDEQRRLSKPVLGPLTVRRLRPRTAIVGRIDPANPDAASSVSGYGAKFTAVDENMRVILPRADARVAAAANQKSQAELLPVATWRKAAKAGRAVAVKRLLTISAVVLLVAASASLGLFLLSESQRGADQRRATAADLAARAVGLRTTDPTLAAKLGLAAHAIDPGNNRAVDALRDVLDDNRNVVRTWQADPSRVDTLAVSEKRDRVLTAGTEHTTKMWKLSSGALLGQISRSTSQMVVAESVGMVAADTDVGLDLFDIGGDKPIELGTLPDATCTTEKQAVVFRFAHNDSALTAVWQDGAVSMYDAVTRHQTMCLTWQETLSPLKFPETLPSNKVVAADIVGDEVVLLLTNNNVVSARTASRDARIEVARDKITGDAALVAASTDTVSVATPHGVAVWKRADQTLLANPLGGLGTQPRVMTQEHGHLLVSGKTGTAVLPIEKDRWVLASSLATLSGGAATVAAINGRAVVSGGPGGRISVIADSSGELALSQQATSTATAFLPDGRLLITQVAIGALGAPMSTNSSGLVLMDPYAPAPSNDPFRWTDGKSPSVFYANAVAATSGMVAASGQANGDGMVLVWTWNDRTSPRRLALPQPDNDKLKPGQRIIGEVAFTPDGKLLVARHVTGQVGVWSTDDQHLLGTVALKPENPRMTVLVGHAFFVDGRGADAGLVDVDLTTRAITRRVAVPGIRFLTASKDGSRVVTMTEDGSVQLYGPDLRPIGDTWRPATSGDFPTDAKLDADGRRLAIAQGSEVLVYDVDTRTVAMPALKAEDKRVVNLSWSPDGQLLAGTTMPPVRGTKQVDPIRIWKTGGMDWTSQVCRWAGSGLTAGEWAQYIGGGISYIDLCAEAHK
jgi:WD40 repeat protein